MLLSNQDMEDRQSCVSGEQSRRSRSGQPRANSLAGCGSLWQKLKKAGTAMVRRGCSVQSDKGQVQEGPEGSGQTAVRTWSSEVNFRAFRGAGLLGEQGFLRQLTIIQQQL